MVLKIGSLLILALLIVIPDSLWAQRYPTKAIRVLVSTGAGGSADTLTRLLAQKLAESFLQQVIIENRSGSGGVIATEVVARAAADGYTLLSAYGSHVINPTLYPKLPYDTLKDFVPITQIGQQPLIVVVHPSLPVRAVKDLVALAKSRPGEVLYVSAGNGSGGHIATEMFISMSGARMTHVPYKGAAAALLSVVGGHTQVMFAGLVNALPHVRAGKLRAIAVTSAKRSPAAPEVPTLVELGYPGYDAVVGYFLLAPAGTPREIIDRLNAEAVKALKSRDLIERFARDGAEPVPRTPEDTAAYIATEIKKWGDVVKATGARND